LYSSSIPTKLDYDHMKKNDWIKARTLELYDMLPQTTLEEREQYTDIRDEIIELNYSFFGYVAKGTYVTDPTVTYEDKLQSALTHFCQMWAKFRFAQGYRTDLSFAVFFKPRLSECIKRELNTIKYSLRRTVCMKAAEQLGIHWGKITKEDIAKVKLSPQEMRILEAIFNVQNNANFDDVGTGIRTTGTTPANFTIASGIDEIYTEQYDELEDLIVHEMIECEAKLTDADLLKMSTLYDIPYVELEKARPLGEEKLKQQLEAYMDVKESFEYNGDVENNVNEIED